MSVDPVEILIAIQVVQAIAALVLAALLRYFFSSFKHSFLRHWALSAAALGTYLATSAAAVAIFWFGSDYAWLRLGFSLLSLVAAYAHVVWLMIGTWEALRQQPVSRRAECWLVGGAALFGLATALVAPFDPVAADLRGLLRVDLRYALTGVAFLISGIGLWRSQHSRRLVGARLGAIGFCLFGLQMFHVVGLNLWLRSGHSPPFYYSYVGLLEFLFQVITGLGIIVWLLEIQRQRTATAHSELAHAQRHDAATGLPNRQMLIEQIAEMQRRAGARRIAVISVGLNRFALIKRALGWAQAESLMNRVANRLHQSISQRCALGRIGERDFVILRPTLDDPERIRVWVENLLGSLVEPVQVKDHELFLTFCAGISLYPDDASDAELLIQNSQQALVQSTQIGRGVSLYHHLGQRDDSRFDAALRFEAELQHALGQAQFELHYQPIMCMADRRVTDFEALLRWCHPTRGVLSPPDFLDEAASLGLLEEIESFVLESALAQLAAWTADGHDQLAISVNFSAFFFQQPGLVERVLRQCRSAGVQPERLLIEITENTAIQDLDSASNTIESLHAAGIRIALDDFGTGYSSLANLLKLKVDRIKLDRIFLENIETDARQRELVAAMIGLGHSLDTEVVAEGIERKAQLEFLQQRGCDLFQGFLIQKPALPDQCGHGKSVI
ncbi:MAG: bifunctional diguanylate cyclase/phosphodiesterase [Wenzhouxiangellaceae bacterium]|nr:bifunctional diguanylate cyclase/phosphodiesterase [Wenzhouxiangellaceae bacterium]